MGERVFRSFDPQGLLYNHDAEDRDNLLHIGLTDQGEDVEINRRAAESDLLVYVNVNLVAMDGGHKSVPIGLASYKSLRHHHNAKTMVRSHSFMDHTKSHLHHSAWRMGRLLKEHLNIFQIETTLNNDVFPAPYDFLMKREWEWSVKDQAIDAGACAAGSRWRRSGCGTRCSTTCARRTASPASTPATPRPCTSGPSRPCTASSWSRCRASPTCW